MPDTTVPPAPASRDLPLSLGMEEEESTSVTRETERSAHAATAPLFDELLLLARTEAEAPSSSLREERRADLAVRAAWLAWDGRGDAQLATSLAMSLAHPGAAALALDLALDVDDAGAIVALTEAALERGDAVELLPLGERVLLLGEASWPGSVGEAGASAATLAVRALSGVGDRARESLATALSAGGRWEELRALREKQGDLSGLLEASHLAHDRLGQPAAALDLVKRALLLDVEAATDPYVIERVLELAPSNVEMWHRKIELLAPEPGGITERAGAQFRLAQLLGPTVEAASLLASLGAGDGDFGALLALEARAQVESTLGNGSAAAAAWASRAERLAVPRWARALWRRSAELYEARGADPAWAEGILLQLHIDDPRDLHCTGALVRLRLAHRDLIGISDVLAASGRALVESVGEDGPAAVALGASLLLRSAHVLELAAYPSRTRLLDVPGRIGALEPAAGQSASSLVEVIARYREALGALDKAGRARPGVDGDHREALQALARLYRQNGERAALAATYLELGALAPAGSESVEQRRAAAYLTVAGAMLLDAGRLAEAEAAFLDAVALDPGDVVAALGRCLCARAVGRSLDETDALARALELAHAAPTRARLLRRLAQVRGDELGDASAAAEDLSQALALHPDDPTTLHHFARLCGDRGEWDQAVEMRERAVQAAGSSPRAVSLLVEIGEICDARLDDHPRAVAAYARALELDPAARPALLSLALLHRRLGQRADLADVLRRRAAFETDPASALALQLEIAELALAHDPPAVEDALVAYREALRLDPTSQMALQSLRHLCEREGRRDALAAALLHLGEQRERRGDIDGAIAVYKEAFAADPGNRTGFTSLERSCYRRQRWSDVMDLYQKALLLVEQSGQVAYRPADLYARRARVELECLGQPEAAAASYLRALELDPETDAHQAALERIYSTQSSGSSWSRLIAAYELRADALVDPLRRADVLRRAVRVATTKLGSATESIRLQARLLAADPADADALDALEGHYTAGESWAKLIEVLRARVAITAGGDEAIALHLRIASICEEGQRDADQSIEAYKQVLSIAPSHREALDALARLYEGTERWVEFVETSRRQIRLVTDRPQKALLFFKCGSVMESKFGRDDEAIRYYDAAIKTSSTCLPAVHGLRDLYLRREDWPRVIESLQLEAKLWSEDKERAVVYAHIGSIYQHKLHDIDRAMQCYESAVGIDRECLAASRSLFELHYARGEYTRALPLGQLLTQKVVREGDPSERSEFYRKRAVVAHAMNDARSAAETLVAALELRSENLEALDFLVEVCRSSPAAWDFAGTFAQLERLYRRAVDAATPGGTPARLLARSLAGLAALRESAFELESAEELLAEAIGLAPSDLPVILATVDLQVRLRRHAIAAVSLEAFLERCPYTPQTRAARRTALVRLAEIHGDVEMDSERALETWQALLDEAPEDLEAHFRLAQELFVLRRFGEAQQSCERLIELAAAPGRTERPEQLARYYDYLGRILEARGDAAAGRNYRRAVDLDPNYPAPLIALARRAAGNGDFAHASSLVETAMRAHSTPGLAASELRRGLARLHVSYGQQRDAIPLLRALVDLPVRPGDATAEASRDDDRLALAELYLVEADLPRAALLLDSVLADNLHQAMAWRLLMELHDRAGQPERAARVAGILRLLGYADIADSTLRNFVATLRRGTLTEELRRTRLLPAAAQGAWADAFAVVREGLEAIFPSPSSPADVEVPLDAGWRVAVSEVQRLLGVDARVRLARGVPGGALSLDEGPSVLLDESIAARPDGERRFVLGRALEPIRGGYALLLRLRPDERAELGRILEQLFLPPGRRDPSAEDFVQSLPRKLQKQLDRLVGVAPERPFEAWVDALVEAADRAGLVACDDVGAAARMLARLGGEELAVTDEGAVLLGQIHGGEHLVRYFLSDAYDEIRSALGQV